MKSGGLCSVHVVVCALVFDQAMLAVKDDSQSLDLSQADSVGLVDNHTLSALTDSKKLSEKKREMLFPIIEQTAFAYKIVKISAPMIDQLNILQATLLGMKQAVAGVRTNFSQSPKCDLSDGRWQ